MAQIGQTVAISQDMLMGKIVALVKLYHRYPSLHWERLVTWIFMREIGDMDIYPLR